MQGAASDSPTAQRLDVRDFAVLGIILCILYVLPAPPSARIRSAPLLRRCRIRRPIVYQARQKLLQTTDVSMKQHILRSRNLNELRSCPARPQNMLCLLMIVVSGVMPNHSQVSPFCLSIISRSG